MSDQQLIILRIEPVAKARPRLGRNGRTYTPAKTASFEKAVKLLLKREVSGRAKFTGALSLGITFAIRRPKSVSPKKRLYPTCKPDLDNYVKAVMDAGNGILWDDDATICELKAEKRYADSMPSCIILFVQEL